MDVGARQLRLRGKEIALQPRIFDLLAYLIDHRDRVVDKEELFSTLWSGVIVTESSLQRAISFARSALREGGMENAIRTYPRPRLSFLPRADSRTAPGWASNCRTKPPPRYWPATSRR